MYEFDEFNDYTLLLLACAMVPLAWIIEGVIMWGV